MPKGTISRLTVRQHRFVRDNDMAWTNWVLFERDKTGRLAQLLPNGKEIELRATSCVCVVFVADRPYWFVIANAKTT